VLLPTLHKSAYSYSLIKSVSQCELFFSLSLIYIGSHTSKIQAMSHQIDLMIIQGCK
jgi:hypothetical protein